jgi:lipopolysaccharide/colanic/teichoic acid biosynthesis glycosyltransferase
MPDLLQRALGLLGAVLALPMLGALAVAVKIDNPGPAMYTATRVGDRGRLFRCFKLRTMSTRPSAGPAITSASDPRITRMGRLLRRTHLDELPQLWNVARGEMRFVGPRPEDPRFVDMAQPLHRLVFAARPGITGLSQLVNADEEAHIAPGNPERTYREEILPAKLRIDAAYLRRRSARLDLWILAQTPRAVLGRTVTLPASVRAEIESGAGLGAASGNVANATAAARIVSAVGAPDGPAEPADA